MFLAMAVDPIETIFNAPWHLRTPVKCLDKHLK